RQRADRLGRARGLESLPGDVAGGGEDDDGGRPRDERPRSSRFLGRGPAGRLRGPRGLGGRGSRRAFRSGLGRRLGAGGALVGGFARLFVALVGAFFLCRVGRVRGLPPLAFVVLAPLLAAPPPAPRSAEA